MAQQSMHKVATNYNYMNTVGKVKRWRAAKMSVTQIVSHPTVVNNYNCHMGGGGRARDLLVSVQL